MTKLIFGGAFDPPHNEHVRLCQSAVKELDADGLVLVPTDIPPHKCEGFLSYDDRAVLARIAFSDFGVPVYVDDIERAEGLSYACEFLPELKKKYGDIIYVIGGDSLQYFESWKNPADILRVCPLAAAARKGYSDVAFKAADITAKYGGDIRVLQYAGGDVSSAVIKAKLLLGLAVRDLPLSVLDYIDKKQFFRNYDSIVRKLKSYQSEDLFHHSEEVALRAVDLNGKFNMRLDFNKVFLAALLHDNAKERPSLDGLTVPEDALGSPVLHQFLGAEKAKRDFGITDEEILSAIGCHTTAKANMSQLEKLIYVADSTSHDRDYDPIPRLAAAVNRDFESGFREVLKYTYDTVMLRGSGIYPLTVEAADYYLDSRQTNI